MRKVVAFSLVGILVLAGTVVATPAPAEAGHRFWTGFAVGTATGLVFSPLVFPRYYYAPAPAYYYPPPVYVAPPPVCYQTSAPGYWTTVPLYGGYGYTTYHYQYVPPQVQTVCR